MLGAMAAAAPPPAWPVHSPCDSAAIQVAPRRHPPAGRQSRVPTALQAANPRICRGHPAPADRHGPVPAAPNLLASSDAA
jgi:hypothetical protein